MIASYGKTVSAHTISVGKTDEEVYAYINNNLFENYYDLSAITQNQDSTFRISLTTFKSLSTNYPYIIVDICSTANLYAYRTSNLGKSCTDSCFSNQVSITKINYECTANGYQGNIYRIKAPISKWGDGVDTETRNVNDQFSIGANIGYYAPNTIYGIYLTDDMTDNLQQIDYTSIINSINSNITNTSNANTDRILNKDNNYNNNPSQNIQGNQEVNDLNDKESQLFDNIDLSGVDVNIGINANANNFIWEIVNRLREMNTNIILLITAALGLGIIKMILNR